MKSLTLLLISSLILLSGCAEKVASFEDEPPPSNITPGEDLIFFWVFDGTLANNTELVRIDAKFAPSGEAYIEFVSALTGYPNTNRKASMERRNAPTDLNYRPEGNNNIPFDQANIRGMQVKQPFEGPNGENTLIFHLPSTGFEALYFSFAAMDEGAASALQFDYSTSAGEPVWTTNGLPAVSINQSLASDDFKLHELNLANIEAANNNPNLKLRVRFTVPDGDLDNGDRVTFNNVALDGTAIN